MDTSTRFGPDFDDLLAIAQRAVDEWTSPADLADSAPTMRIPRPAELDTLRDERFLAAPPSRHAKATRKVRQPVIKLKPTVKLPRPPWLDTEV
jgi:hypothetical protein